MRNKFKEPLWGEICGLLGLVLIIIPSIIFLLLDFNNNERYLLLLNSNAAAIVLWGCYENKIFTWIGTIGVIIISTFLISDMMLYYILGIIFLLTTSIFRTFIEENR